jgi:hypothetical protein
MKFRQKGKNWQVLGRISVRLARSRDFEIRDLRFSGFRFKPYLCLSVFICGLRVFAGSSQIGLPQVPQKRPPGTLTVPHWQQ